MRLYFHKKIVFLMLFSNALSMAKMPLSLFVKATKSGTVKRLLNVTPAASPSLSRVIANPALQTQKANYAPSRNVWTTSTQNNANQRNRLALLLDKARPRKGYLNAFGKVAALGTFGATANAIGIYKDIIDYEEHPIACLAAVCTVMPFIYAIESTKKYKCRATRDTVIFPSDFTRSNIDRCNANGKMREGFIVFATKNIATTNNEMIETIGYLLKRYPESRTRLIDAALSDLNDVHPSMFKNVISYSSKKEFLLRAKIFYARVLPREEEKFREKVEKLLQYNPSLEELIYLHYNYVSNRYYGDDVKKKYSLSNPLPSTFPLWLYDDPYYSLKERIKHTLYRDLSSLPSSYYSYIYDHILDYDAEKKEFREKMTLSLKDGLLPIHQTNVLHAAMQNYDQNSVPFLMHCSQDNHQTTQSEKHFCANISSVMEHMFREHTIKQKTNAIPMFKRAIAKEREERAKGNHVFYHGRKWEYDFWADMDKYTYNLANPHQPLTDIRLRFDKQEGALCLNYALFANATNRSSNTASYVVNNHDFSGSLSRFKLDWPFRRFGLEKHFYHHRQEFEKLRTLHAACNKHGSLLMFSIPDKHVDIVYPAAEGSMGWDREKREVSGEYTADTRAIINALKTSAESIQEGDSDRIEFALRITPDLKDKVRIYPMSQADPAKYKEYTDYRDHLFAKIKTDMQGAQ